MATIAVPISVVIHTKNAGKTLGQCLDSVTFSDDVVVVDMHSTDATIAIATAHKARVVTVDDVGFADPMRNFGISQAKHDWVLVLDADEEVSSGLCANLPSLISSDTEVWQLPRKNIIFGQWMQYGNWWPDYQIRVFKKGTVSWTDKVHTPPVVTGKMTNAPIDESYSLIHHHYETVVDFVDRLNRYTSLEMDRRNDQSFSNEQVITHAIDDFFRRYFAFNGYRDGAHGTYLSLLQGVYELIVGIKQWEHYGFDSSQVSIESIADYVSHAYHYWHATYRIQSAHNFVERLFWKIRRKLTI